MRFRPRLLPLVAAAIVAGIDIAYLALVDESGGRIAFVSGSLAVAGLLAVAGAVLERGLGAVIALSVSASTLLVWSFLGIFSIGALIAVPAVIVLASLGQAFDDERMAERWLAVAAAAATLVATAWGVALT